MTLPTPAHLDDEEMLVPHSDLVEGPQPMEVLRWKHSKLQQGKRECHMKIPSLISGGVEIQTIYSVGTGWSRQGCLKMIDSNSHLNHQSTLVFFSQIVKGLGHIHERRIIHWDLTPNNIFIDDHDDIEVGDFGPPKFLRLEQLDQDPSGPPLGTTGESVEYIGKVNTPRYTVPEIEQGWRKYDEKIVKGLAHMHREGIIHWDLTPNNIFIDAQNVVKSGDLGLAKILRFEQLDQDPSGPPGTRESMEFTGNIGTWLYTAPEIEQGWQKYDEKVDIYSLGVVLFELMHPFRTDQERIEVLTDLKKKGELPSSWVADNPELGKLVRRLISPSPSECSHATEVLEDEVLLPIRCKLLTMERLLEVVKAIFDKVKNLQHGERSIEGQ